MRTPKTLVALAALAALTFVLTSCSSGTSGNGGGTQPLSFTVLVPTGMTAYATLQTGEGSVVETKTVDPGTKSVRFTDAATDSLVTVSMEAPYGNAGSRIDYLNLTLPAGTVSGHEVYVIDPIANAVSVDVTLTCPTGANDVGWWASGGKGGTALCSAGTFTVQTTSDALQSDGTLSMVLIAYDSTGAPIDYVTKLDQNIASGSLTVAASDWTGSPPPTDSATFTFPALQTGDGVAASLTSWAILNGQRLSIGPVLNGSTSTAGSDSIAVAGEGVPVSGAQYNVYEKYTRTFSGTGGANWRSYSIRDHGVPAVPFTENVAAGSDVWPALDDAHWVDNGGSPTIAYTPNAGTAAATFAYAVSATSDTTTTPVVNKTWFFFAIPHAFDGTVQYPDMPASLSGFVPTALPTGTSTTNRADLFFADFQMPLYATGMIPASFDASAGLPREFHAVEAFTNSVTTSALSTSDPLGGGGLSRIDRPHFGLR